MLPSPAFLHVPRQVQERGGGGAQQTILIDPSASHRAKIAKVFPQTQTAPVEAIRRPAGAVF